MKKLILTLTVAFITVMTSKAQDTVYFDPINQMVVNASNANNPSVYTQDSSKTDTLFTFNSGVQNVWTVSSLYSYTMPTTHSSYKVDFSVTHAAGAFDFDIDTNFTTLYSGVMIVNQTQINNAITSNSMVLNSGDVLDFNISNTVNAGRYQVVLDVIHTVDTVFVTNLTTSLSDNNFEKNSVSFTVYPNPTVDYLNISGDVTQNATFSVFSVNGSLVKEGSLESNTIDVTSLNRGNYVLMLNTLEGKTLTKQFIKQ